MKNPQKREVMLQAYRLLEQFEQPNETEAYWDGLRDACVKFCADWPGDGWSAKECVKITAPFLTQATASDTLYVTL